MNMKKDFPYLPVAGYGAAHWFSVLAVSFLLFPIRQNDPIFFETLISIVLVAATILFGFIFLRRYRPISFQEALFSGAIWMVMSILLDQLLFTFGPLKMDIISYFKDIGLTYLIIPIILGSMEYYHDSVVSKETKEKIKK